MLELNSTSVVVLPVVTQFMKRGTGFQGWPMDFKLGKQGSEHVARIRGIVKMWHSRWIIGMFRLGH